MIQETLDMLAPIGITSLLVFVAYEFINGKYKDGKKTKQDWQMAGICLAALAFVQRPLLAFLVFGFMTALFPSTQGAFQWIDQEYFWPGLLVFILVDELFHGGTHFISHRPSFKNKVLVKVQNFIKAAHRPHHFSGGNDGKGQLNVTQTYVEGWGWALILPNYIIGLAVLYMGMYQIFLVGTALKGLWALHNHCNWNYDLWLLNHKNIFVRKSMYALCHVITFPTQHHQHHSRGKNSAKNMQNLLAVYDWLLWGTLVIEKTKPDIYGWRQNEIEEKSVMRRFLQIT